MTHSTVEETIGAAQRALVLGIGGGGDVVGSLAIARLCESLGTEFVLGGVAWERFAIDPHPGPRPLEQIVGGRQIGRTALLADAETTTPEGVRFAESGMAGFLGRKTVLIDVTGGPIGVAEGILAATAVLGCDLGIYVDVGGDAIASGPEPGLASPLCDAVMLAGARRAATEVPALGAVFGAGCDAELTPDEVLDRIAAIARAGAWRGAWGMPPQVSAELADAAAVVPTEASLMAVRCAQGETGEAPIRGGRRTVNLGPLGALTFFFDLHAGRGCLPLADAVADAADLEGAREALAARGLRTELDYERGRARESA